MQITFYSILAAVFWSGILAGMLYIMRKKCQSLRRFGAGCIVLVYLLCMARMLIPVDFSFTRGISLRGIFASVCDILYLKEISVGSYMGTVWNIILGVWLLGTAAVTFKFVREYRSTHRLANMLTERKDAQCRQAMQKVYAEKGRKYEVTVLKGNGITIPFGIGIFNRKILLPDEEYTDDMLYFVLLHEYTHFVNGDLVLKILAHVLCCVFWWNPIVYYIQKDLETRLEVQCDLCVTERLSLGDMLIYMQTIVTTLKKPKQKRKFPAIKDMVSLSDESEEMIERFGYIKRSQMGKKENKKAIAAWFLAFVIVWAASYSFIFLPSYDAPIEEIETDADTYAVLPENSYILYKDGNYYVVSQEGLQFELEEEAAKEMESYGYQIKEEQ